MTRKLNTSPDSGGSSSRHLAFQSASSDSHGPPEAHLFPGLPLASSPPSWVSQITASTWQPLITWSALMVLTPHQPLVETAGLAISSPVYSQSLRRPFLRTLAASNIYKSLPQFSSPFPSCSSLLSTLSTGTVLYWENARHSRSSFSKGEWKMVAGGCRWCPVPVTDPSLGRGDPALRTAEWEVGKLVMLSRSLWHRVWATGRTAMCTRDLRTWRRRRQCKGFADFCGREGVWGGDGGWNFWSDGVRCKESTAFAYISSWIGILAVCRSP